MNVLQECEQPAALQKAVAEYKKMLAYQKLDELHALARRWNVKLASGNKASIMEQLAAQFGQPYIQQAMLAELDDLGHQILAYMHLLLAPEYGLSADSIVRGMLHQRQRAAQPARTEEPLLSAYDRQWTQDAALKRSIQEQIVELAQCGLLLPFRQNSALYYTLPDLVRTRLPSRPSLIPAYTADAEPLEAHETTFGTLIHNLFTVWNMLSRGIPGTPPPPIRPSAPDRQPIEDQWSLLRGWDHEPSEIAILARNQYPGRRSSQLRSDRLSAAALNWAVTIPAPIARLQDLDRQHLRLQVGGTDDQIEFYYALLESIGALAGEPGEPIVVRKSALQHFLSLSASAKIGTLWHAWTNDKTWTGIRSVMNQDGQPKLQLRRSLTQYDFKAEDLYQEWYAGRRIVLRFLSLLPEDRWFSTDGLLKTVFDIHPNLLHTASDSSVWWLESSRTGRQFGTAFEDWQQSYGQFVLSMLKGPLYWLGIVRLGYVTPDPDTEKTILNPVAFQLTETGLFALGRRAELIPAHLVSAKSEGACCSVSDKLVVSVVPDQAPLDLHDLLHSTGRLVEATPDRFIYQLTADGISGWLASDSAKKAASAESEASIEALIALLGKYCDTSVTTWQEKLRTWERNRGLLHIYENITLIELADDYALHELLISTSLADYLVYQFSPRLVAIWAEGIDPLVEEMEARGYTPRIQ